MSKMQTIQKKNPKLIKKCINRKRGYCKTTTLGSKESQQHKNTNKKKKNNNKNQIETKTQLFEKNVDGEVVDILGVMSKKMYSRLTEEQKKRRRTLRNKINAQNNRNQKNKKLRKLEDTLIEILNKHEQLNSHVTELEQRKETLQTELEKLKTKVQKKRSSKKRNGNRNRSRRSKSKSQSISRQLKQNQSVNQTKNQKQKEINPIFDSLIQQNFFNSLNTRSDNENENRNEIENEIINQTINQSLYEKSISEEFNFGSYLNLNEITDSKTDFNLNSGLKEIEDYLNFDEITDECNTGSSIFDFQQDYKKDESKEIDPIQDSINDLLPTISDENLEYEDADEGDGILSFSQDILKNFFDNSIKFIGNSFSIPSGMGNNEEENYNNISNFNNGNENGNEYEYANGNGNGNGNENENKQINLTKIENSVSDIESKKKFGFSLFIIFVFLAFFSSWLPFISSPEKLQQNSPWQKGITNLNFFDGLSKNIEENDQPLPGSRKLNMYPSGQDLPCENNVIANDIMIFRNKEQPEQLEQSEQSEQSEQQEKQQQNLKSPFTYDFEFNQINKFNQNSTNFNFLN
ncbi:a-type inclusion protein [Anaeramoeba flamelloides]|uniref:A-type inclusion protein n=1 Tax=Anaeramoeba flamelloides TaxID=1746091 RepID=A0AAV7ZX20_9EUKA|nr:a-type inclusion protein [Anaeramoeba flamelloides]